MAEVKRKVTFRLYPKKRQKFLLNEIFRLHQRLYNGCLEQRILLWKQNRRSLSFSEQCRELTLLRKECPEYERLNAQSMQVTLKRLDLAFGHFYRRVKRKETPGFPRFKSLDRFRGWGYKTHGDGWKLFWGGRHGYLRLSGVGNLKLRGKARVLGTPKTIEICQKADRWYASLTMICEDIKRESGLKAVGIDWGVETFATIAKNNGSYDQIDNERFLKKSLCKLKQAQRNISRKQRGSKNRKKKKIRLIRIHEKIANQRKNFTHQKTTKIVKEAALIAIEKLNIKAMIRAGGSRKRGLNREILNTTPGVFHSMLKYKAEEAGIEIVEVPTKKVKPSQTCSGCGDQKKKELQERTHSCKKCGLILGRDQNAARVILNWGLFNSPTGWEPSRCGEEAPASSAKHEAPSIFALAN